MAINFLIDYLTGQLAMVMNTGSATPPTGGTALFADTTSINFIDSTNMNWIA